MRRISGWSSKTMPNMSYVSRSHQFAPIQTEDNVGTCGSFESHVVRSMTKTCVSVPRTNATLRSSVPCRHRRSRSRDRSASPRIPIAHDGRDLHEQRGVDVDDDHVAVQDSTLAARSPMLFASATGAAARSTWLGAECSVPIERLLLPGVEEADDEDRDEDRHLNETEPPRSRKSTAHGKRKITSTSKTTKRSANT